MSKVGAHLEAHKEKYMYAGVLLSAFLHALNGMAIKTFVLMVVAFYPLFK